MNETTRQQSGSSQRAPEPMADLGLSVSRLRRLATREDYHFKAGFWAQMQRDSNRAELMKGAQP